MVTGAEIASKRACFAMTDMLYISIIVVILYGNIQLLRLMELYILNECTFCVKIISNKVDFFKIT